MVHPVTRLLSSLTAFSARYTERLILPEIQWRRVRRGCSPASCRCPAGRGAAPSCCVPAQPCYLQHKQYKLTAVLAFSSLECFNSCFSGMHAQYLTLLPRIVEVLEKACKQAGMCTPPWKRFNLQGHTYLSTPTSGHVPAATGAAAGCSALPCPGGYAGERVLGYVPP